MSHMHHAQCLQPPSVLVQFRSMVSASCLDVPHACSFALSCLLVSLPSSNIGSASEMSQVHLILRHKSPKTGEIEEKHLKLPPSVLLDNKTHVYTAVLHPNNT